MWLAFTKSTGGRIAATEFMNEPTYAAMGGAPKGYNTADFDRDIVVFSCYGDPLRLALAGCTHVGTIAFRG